MATIGEKNREDHKDDKLYHPHTKDDLRQQDKRTGKKGKPGKAGRIPQKGGAGTSNKWKGGKGAS